MSNIGHRIAQLRKDKGWSQTELAAQAGASREAIGKYERGEASPSIGIAKKIADVLGVSLDYLAGDTSVLIKDKSMIYRLEMLQQVNATHKDRILYLLDLMLKDAQNQSIDKQLTSS